MPGLLAGEEYFCLEEFQKHEMDIGRFFIIEIIYFVPQRPSLPPLSLPCFSIILINPTTVYKSRKERNL